MFKLCIVNELNLDRWVTEAHVFMDFVREKTRDDRDARNPFF